jgi:hypothetical protein
MADEAGKVQQGGGPDDEGFTKVMSRRDKKEATRATKNNENQQAAAGAHAPQPKDAAGPSATQAEGGRRADEAAGKAKGPAPAMRQAPAAASGQPAKPQQGHKQRSTPASKPVRTYSRAPLTVTLEVDADETTKIMVRETVGRVVLQFAAPTSQRLLGDSFSKLDHSLIASRFEAALTRTLEGSASGSGPPPALKVGVSYVPFKNSSTKAALPFGVYLCQLTVSAPTAARIRGVLEGAGRMPEVEVQLDAGQVLHMTMMRQGSNPVDTSYDSKRLPRLIRIAAVDEVTLLGAAEMLRCMASSGLVGGVSWVGSGAAEGAEAGSALAFPEGAQSMGAADLHAAMQQAPTVPLQLPGWACAPAPGEFVALVWGGSREVVERPKLGVNLPVRADAAPEGSSLHGRSAVPFTVSCMQPGAKAAPKPAPRAPGSQPSTYAAAAGAPRAPTSAVSEGREGTAQVAGQLQAMQQELAAAEAEAERAKAQSAQLSAALTKASQQAKEATQQRTYAEQQRMEELKELQTLKAELAKRDKEAEDALAKSTAVESALADARMDAQQYQSQLVARKQQLDDTQRALQLTQEEHSYLERISRGININSSTANTETALLDACKYAVSSLLSNGHVTYQGGHTAPQEAVQQAAQAVCDRAIDTWGLAEVGRWRNQGFAARCTLTQAVFQSYLPPDWRPADVGTTGTRAQMPDAPSPMTKTISPAGHRMLQAHLGLQPPMDATAREPSDTAGGGDQQPTNWLQQLLPTKTRAHFNSSQARVETLMSMCMRQLAREVASSLDRQQPAPMDLGLVERLAVVGMGKMYSGKGTDWQVARDWLMGRVHPPTSKEEVQAMMLDGAATPPLPHA